MIAGVAAMCFVFLFILLRGQMAAPAQSSSTQHTSLPPPVPPPILTATAWEQISIAWAKEFLHNINDVQSWRTYTNSAAGFKVMGPVEHDISAPADCVGTEGLPGIGRCQDEFVYQPGFQHYDEHKNELSMLMPPEYEKNAIAVFAMPKTAGDTLDNWGSRYVQPRASMEKKTVKIGAYTAAQIHATFAAGKCPSIAYVGENGAKKTIDIPCAGRNEATIFVINGTNSFIVGVLSLPAANRSLYLELYQRILATAEFL